MPWTHAPAHRRGAPSPGRSTTPPSAGGSPRDAHPVTLYADEEMAKGKMGQGACDGVAGGATDEITLRRTRAVCDALMRRPRMRVAIGRRALGTPVLGQDIRFPVVLEPAGHHAAAHPAGERASARAAGAAGAVLGLSAQSSRTLEEAAQAATGPLWCQS
jgi:isopentenyl diphosphate isomerase/L-lactate dehydrogenase-like FMN-dependent dehydrogenase